MPFFGISQPAEKACFSVPGGFYEESPVLELFPFYPQHHIRFTTNGNRPTAQSRLYTEPLLLDESLYSTSDIYTIQVAPDGQMFYPDSIQHCIVIRAAVFDEDENCISEVASNSYFIHSLGCDTHGLPVVSLCADSLDLFDYENGILVPGIHYDSLNPKYTGNYCMRGDEWERLANVEFYELNNEGINQLTGLRTRGMSARLKQQKGLQVFAREEYGNKRFLHCFFEEIHHNSFKHLSLKPYACAWNGSGCKDYISNRIARRLNMEVLASRPAVLFLNGEYWGVYYVQEKPDERYLEDHFNLDIEKINIIKNWNSADCGDMESFNAFYEWMQQADLSNPDQYTYAKTHIDIDNFVDYYIFELFSSNLDWPANNVRLWQHDGSKWRFFFFDGDACFEEQGFDVFANAVYLGAATYPSSNKASLFFRRLIENDQFKDQFTRRFNQLVATVFSYQETKPFFDYIKSVLEQEVPHQIERFGSPSNISTWNYYCMAVIDRFLMNRPGTIIDALNKFISVREPVVIGFQCFPNPFVDQLTLQVNAKASKQTEVHVFNTLGQEVHAQTVMLDAGSNTIRMDVSLPSGCYVLKIDNLVTKVIRQ